MNPHLALLLSDVYRDNLATDHVADLAKSGITADTIRRHRIRSVPPAMISVLLGFDIPAIRSAMLIPFPSPAGGFMDHVRIKVFPPLRSRGQHIKYLQPRGSGTRLFFTLIKLEEVIASRLPLWIVGGEKK